MKRRLFTILSAPSLLLFIAAIIVWARSYFVPAQVTVNFESGTWALRSRNGVVEWTNLPAVILATKQQAAYKTQVIKAAFGIVPQPSAPPPAKPLLVRYAIHYAFPTMLAAILPGLWLSHCWRSRRRPGLCPRCGYDLRATPHRCPECGAAVPPDR